MGLRRAGEPGVLVTAGPDMDCCLSGSGVWSTGCAFLQLDSGTELRRKHGGNLPNRVVVRRQP